MQRAILMSDADTVSNG